MQGLEDSLSDLRVVDEQPEIPVLTVNQKRDRLKAKISNKQTDLTNRGTLLESSLNAVIGRLSDLQLTNYKETCQDIETIMQSELTPMYADLEELDADDWQTNQQTLADFTTNITQQVENVRYKAISLVSEQSAPGSSGPRASSNDQSLSNSYTVYKKEDIPTFKGDIRGYPPFKREWQRLVAAGQSEDWQLTNLQNKTPDKVDLSNCETVAEAWERLYNKYASPTLVSHELITEFHSWRIKSKGEASRLIELEHKLSTLHRDLQAVNQESQITDNLYLLSSAIKMIPVKYQEDLIKLRCEKEGQEGETLWKILKGFLSQKRRMIKMYSPWDLDGKEDKKSDDLKSKPCDVCQSHKHKTRDCPIGKSSVRLTNAMNVKDDAIFKSKQAEYGPCPVCSKGHSFRSRSGFDLASCRLYDCPDFVPLSAEERAKKIQST